MAEKEYVLGNKTKDLLVYTFTVTKPIGDKTVDIDEVIKTLRALKGLSADEQNAFVEETVSTLAKNKSKQGFPKSAVHTYVNVIR